MTTDTQTIKLAIIVGQHPYDVPEFTRMMRRLSGVDVYLQDLENWAADVGKAREAYDTLLFYNMHREPPNDACRRAVESLATAPQGVIIMHHAILAFAGWAPWSDLVGITDRSFKYYPNQAVPVSIADDEHPISQGLAPWTMLDETYTLAEPGADSRVLLRTDHPNSVRALAWTQQRGEARTLVTVLGHGREAYTDPGFQTVLSRGIRWAAGRL